MLLPKILIVITSLGLLVFLIMTAFVPFRNKLLTTLYPKENSFAAGLLDQPSALGAKTSGLSKSSDAPEPLALDPKLLSAGSSGVTIFWTTSDETAADLYLGKQKSQLTHAPTSMTGQNLRQARISRQVILTKLEPNTVYYYQITAHTPDFRKYGSAEGSFKTNGEGGLISH